MKKSQSMVHMYIRMYPYKVITNKKHRCMLTPCVECYMRYIFTPNLMIHFKQLTCLWRGCKQWTGLLEWWNSGMVDWIIFIFVFIIYHVVASLYCLHLPSYSHNST